MTIAEKFAVVRARIAEAAAKSNRRPDAVELVAISKTHDVETVRTAVDAGQLLFGESRVQEARAKIPLLPSHLRWHLVGHLQKNKIRHALPLFEMIHSVDSIELARAIERVAQEAGLYPQILLEINVAGEGNKFGFSAEKLSDEIDSLLSLRHVSVQGLMCIPPLAREAEASRKYFVQLRELRDTLEKKCDIDLPHLSMGMTNDYSVAVEEGATLVRVGTALFGERKRSRVEVSYIA